MGTLNWEEVERILDQALDLPEEERLSYVHKACNNRPKLKKEVELILTSIKESEGWLEDPGQFKREFFSEISKDLEQHSGEQSLIGKQIGSYKVKEKIGEGGMGSVFLAERSEGDFKHQVAIKMVRSAKATPKNLDRFEQEKKILASLKHAGIAQLYDGGVTDDGIPYIIMEYVDGTPITEYCEKNECSVTQKIELFNEVLEAVQNAHENLIIHSDLKPENIFINKSGNVKILDFGISKLLRDKDELAAQQDQDLLTPRFAAPEQITEAPITTATDIYALGLIFYKLMTGKNVVQLESFDREQVKESILEKNPVKPSMRVSDNQMQKKLSGDLDAIILQAIHKDPKARYRSASDFISDLDHYLKDLPVSARENSLAYRSRKFVNRHHRGISLFSMMIILTFGLTIFYTNQIKTERNQAQIEAEKSEEITNFVIGLLEENYPENSQGDTVTVRQILDKSANRIQMLDKTPEVRAKLLQVIGHAYNSVGEPLKARPLLKRSIQIHDSLHLINHDLAHTYNVAGLISRDVGNLDSARTFLENSINTFRELGLTDIPEYPKALKNLAYVHRMRSEYEQALNLVEEALNIEEELYEAPDPNIAETIYILASIERYLGNYDQALAYQKESLDMLEATVETPHPGIVSNLSNIAVLYDIKNDPQKAKTNYQKALPMARKLYGENHSQVAVLYSNISSIYLKEAKFDSAEAFIRQSLDITEQTSGKSNPRYAHYINKMAELKREQGQFHPADSLYNMALNIFRNAYDETHPEVANMLHNLAYVSMGREEYQEALGLLNRSMEIRKANFKNSHPSIQRNVSTLVEVYEQLDMTAKADSLSQLLTSNQEE